MKFTQYIIIIFFLFFIACNRKKLEFLPIPSDAEIILKVNTSSLGSKLLFDNQDKLHDLFKGLISNTFIENIIANPGKVGIDYLKPIYFFQRNGIKYGIVHLDNEKEFNQFISKNQLKVSTNTHFKTTQVDNIFITWHTHLAIFQFAADNQEYSQGLINIKKEQTIYSNEQLKKSLEESADALLLANLHQLFTTKSSKLQPFADKHSVSKLNFDDGKIEIETTHLFQAQLKNQIKNLNATQLSIIYKEDQAGFLGISLNPEFFLEFLNGDTPAFITNYQINKFKLINETKGDLYIRLDSIYKKTEIIEKRETFIPSFISYVPLNNNVLISDLLAKLHKDQILDFRYANNYYFDLFNSPIYIKTNGNALYSSSRSMEGFPEKTPCKKCTNLTSLFLYFELNPKKLHLSHSLDSHIDKFSIRGEASKDMNLKTEILFHKRGPNGLISFIEVLKTLNDSTQVIF